MRKCGFGFFVTCLKGAHFRDFQEYLTCNLNGTKNIYYPYITMGLFFFFDISNGLSILDVQEKCKKIKFKIESRDLIHEIVVITNQNLQVQLHNMLVDHREKV